MPGLFSRKSKNLSDAVRMCFVTDIHGSERCFKKFLNAGRFYDVRHLILGGDITGKTMIPIERANGGWRATYGDHKYEDLTESERAELEQLIRDNGQYPVVGERDELAERFSPEQRDQTFENVVVASIRRWMDLAQTRLAGSGIRCYVTPGNDDFWAIDDALRESEVVEYVEGRCVRLDENHEMVTTGYSNITPWNSPRELDEPELSARLEEMFTHVEDSSNLIAVLHPPPRATELDQAPVIDEQFRVQSSAGEVRMGPVGSSAVRDFIEQHQPLLALHGHVHESKGAETIGRTLCINPGSEYSSGVLNCAVVSLFDDRPPEYQFTTG
jgi:Icc-related predicted phosphoesterase